MEQADTSTTKVAGAGKLSGEQNPEEGDATDDDSSTKAGYKILFLPSGFFKFDR